MTLFLFIGQDGSYGGQHWKGVLAYTFGESLICSYQAYLVNLMDIRRDCRWFVATRQAEFRWGWKELEWFYFLSKFIPAKTLGGILFEGHQVDLFRARLFLGWIILECYLL